MSDDGTVLAEMAMDLSAGRVPTMEERMDNARLMAAAPQLLAKLQRILDARDTSHSLGNRFYEEVEDLIDTLT